MSWLARVVLVVTSALVTSWLSIAPANAAAALPQFDSALYCRRVGIIGMTTSLTTWSGCTAQERQSRDRLVPRWSTIAATVSTVCQQTAMFSGAGSYAVLEGCIARMERLKTVTQPITPTP
jgi:hypothetical protein